MNWSASKVLEATARAATLADSGGGWIYGSLVFEGRV